MIVILSLSCVPFNRSVPFPHEWEYQSVENSKESHPLYFRQCHIFNLKKYSLDTGVIPHANPDRPSDDRVGVRSLTLAKASCEKKIMCHYEILTGRHL